MKITLSESALAQLRNAAEDRGEPMARLAASLVCAGLSTADQGPQDSPPDSADMVESDRGFDRRAPWLEPWEDEREWRRDMWASINGLHERYPRELAYLFEALEVALAIDPRFEHMNEREMKEATEDFRQAWATRPIPPEV
jgi:hypothetical protein